MEISPWENTKEEQVILHLNLKEKFLVECFQERVITWSISNYLGLSNHPEIREIDAKAQKNGFRNTYGFKNDV